MAEEQHPITPPPELIRQWNEEAATAPMADQRYIAIQAARWGGDQELDACCEWLAYNYNYPEAGNPLRAARRPPPSLKELALRLWTQQVSQMTQDFEIIRRALERLQELEGQDDD